MFKIITRKIDMEDGLKQRIDLFQDKKKKN